MCDPLTAATIGLGVASTVLGTVGSVNAGRYQAAVAENAAQVATQQASFEASRQAIDTTRALARQRAAYAAAGIGSSGTPLDVGVDLAGEGRMEERRILYEGAIRANEQLSQARLSRYSARVDLLQGLTEAGSDLLGEMKGFKIGSVGKAPNGYRVAGASGAPRGSRYPTTS